MTIRTIDNLGLESSVRYAKDKESLDRRIIEDSKYIPKKTEIPVTSPYIQTESEKLFSSKPTVRWAYFTAPYEIETNLHNLFSYEMIPSFGGDDKIDQYLEKLQAQPETEESHKLIEMFKTTQSLQKTFDLIQSRRGQYQKG